jgi:hypothetical protein
MNNTPHPNLISNWTRKTQAKIWYMLMAIVLDNQKKEEIEIWGLVELCKKYHLWDKTLNKYLKNNIFQDTSEKNKKLLHLWKNDIILIKEAIYLENRYQNFSPPQKKLIKYLLERLWRML